MDPYRQDNSQGQDAGIAADDQKVDLEADKPVFQESEKKQTPQWLEQASQNDSTQIIGAGETPNLAEILRAEKPTAAELGVDPSSSIDLKPNLEVVNKVDQQVKEKMLAAGLDPNTGKPLGQTTQPVDPQAVAQEVAQKQEEPTASDVAAPVDVPVAPQISPEASAAEAQKKNTLLGNVKNIMNERAEKHAETIQKVDQADAAKKTGKKVDISKQERQQYIEAEKIYQEGLARIKDIIAPSSMEIKYDGIRIDGMYAKSFYVYAYPRYIDTNWLAPVINFDVTMDISQFIYPISSEQIMKTLKRKVAQMQSSIRINQDKGKVRDPALETALEDAEVLRTEIQRGQEKFFQFALYFTVYSEDEKKLEKVSKQLESLLAGKLVMTKRAQLQAEQGFNSSIPIALDEIYTIRNMNTSPLSASFPFTSSDLTSDKGVLYGLNRHNDSLIIFDRFALENANSVVFAKSGAGKSYAVKLEILRLMMLGTDVIVIDPENEYEELSTTVGGSYLRLSLNSDRRINPFDLAKPMEGETVQAGDILRSNVINLQGLLKIMLGEISPEEESILDKALIDVYALKGITMDLVDPSVYEPPTMEDLAQILGSMEGAQSLVQRLSKFTTGSYSGIFNKQTNVDLSSGLMVFSIRDLEDALRPIAMYIILNYIWAKVRSNLKKRVLVVDEAWSMMQHDDSAKFLFGLVKRARKYYLGVTTITQDVDDFIKNQYGKPIVTNSSMQLLLKQAPSSVELLGKVFNLTEGEKYVLLNSGVGQGLFFAGQKHVAVQVIASYGEDKIVTTNPEELLKAKDPDANK